MTSLELPNDKDLNIPKDDSYETKMNMWGEVEESEESLKVLDPDDPLMRRFQDALKAHLVKINDKLMREIDELRISTKDANKKREQKGLEMYDAQQAILRQETSIETYTKNLEDMTKSREEKEHRLKELSEIRNKVRGEVNEEKQMAETIMREMEITSLSYKKFTEYEDEISNHLAVAKRMSEKDACTEREMIRQKQEADYILLKLTEQVWKLEREVDDMRMQMKIKDSEREAIYQTIADADADLQVLQRERASLMESWNGVISGISQRDKIFADLSLERSTMRESFQTLIARSEKLQKETVKEMENNEKLTIIKSRLEEEMISSEQSANVVKDQLDALQYKTNMMTKFANQSETEYTNVLLEQQYYTNQSLTTNADLDKLKQEKRILENQMMLKLEERMLQDKTMRNLTNTLRGTRENVDELELSMLQVENVYGKNLLDFERLSNSVSIKKEQLEEIILANVQRDKMLNDLESEVEKYTTLIDRKQRQLTELTNKIEEINKSTGGIDLSPEDVKVVTLEKEINEIDVKNQGTQQLWLRKEGILIQLTQEQDEVLEELNRLNKQIMIMEQKNYKLEFSLNKETQLERSIDKRMNTLHQRLLKTNAVIAEQKEMKDCLHDKNLFTKDEFTKTLQMEETELIKLQNSLKELSEEKLLLEDKLRNANQEYLSWSKKVKLATETAKMIRDEQNPGGEVAAMRSEIHKMEMRLSHLRKAQEKMIKDMEHCVSRREMIMDAALAREQKIPQQSHNKQVLFEKRMDGRRMKIKQMVKDTKIVENKILDMQEKKLKLEKEIEGTLKVLKEYESEIVQVDKQFVEAEIMKHHKLECLVRKQRKIELLQKIRDGKYKMFHKTEAIVKEEFDKQKALNNDLVEILEQTSRDFPLLKDKIRKILLTIQLNN